MSPVLSLTQSVSPQNLSVCPEEESIILSSFVSSLSALSIKEGMVSVPPTMSLALPGDRCPPLSWEPCISPGPGLWDNGEMAGPGDPVGWVLPPQTGTPRPSTSRLAPPD